MTTKTDATSDEREREIRASWLPVMKKYRALSEDTALLLKLLDEARARSEMLDKDGAALLKQFHLERQAAKVLEEALLIIERESRECLAVAECNEALQRVKEIREGLK